MVAGTRSMRTTVASSSTAVANPVPKSLMIRSSSRTVVMVASSAGSVPSGHHAGPPTARPVTKLMFTTSMPRSEMTTVVPANTTARPDVSMATTVARADPGSVPPVCGRFVSTSSPADMAAYFGAGGDVPDDPGSRYNVAPTDDVLVVHADGGPRRVDAFHWGLVPGWADDPKVGSRMINARAETLATKGAFKAAFGSRRCLVPADGFYEWAEVPGGRRKQPYFVHRPDGEPFAFAGLWERWRGPVRDGSEALRSTTIITTTANRPMAAIHDRMPVVLPASAWDEWLDPGHDDIEALERLLVPAPDAITVLRPIGSDVGNVRNEGPALIERVEPTAPGGDRPLPGFAG